MWNMLLSAVVKIGAVMFLTVTPLNIVGAAWASNINFGLAALLNIIFLLRSGITFNVKVLAKLLAATLLMAAAAELIYTFVNGLFGNTIAAITTIFAAIAVYAVLLFVLKAVSKDDLEKIPFIGSKIKRR
jgi:stage V sporulation protein B